MDDETFEIRRSASVKDVLKRYESQLLNARQLARFKARQRAADGLEIADPDPEPNRKRAVSQIVEELSLSLAMTGAAFPALEEIRKELSRRMNKEVEFIYPPGKRMRILIREENGRRPLTGEEQNYVDGVLAAITRQKVDASVVRNF